MSREYQRGPELEGNPTSSLVTWSRMSRAVQGYAKQDPWNAALRITTRCVSSYKQIQFNIQEYGKESPYSVFT